MKAVLQVIMFGPKRTSDEPGDNPKKKAAKASKAKDKSEQSGKSEKSKNPRKPRKPSEGFGTDRYWTAKTETFRFKLLLEDFKDSVKISEETIKVLEDELGDLSKIKSKLTSILSLIDDWVQYTREDLLKECKKLQKADDYITNEKKYFEIVKIEFTELLPQALYAQIAEKVIAVTEAIRKLNRDVPIARKYLEDVSSSINEIEYKMKEQKDKYDQLQSKMNFINQWIDLINNVKNPKGSPSFPLRLNINYKSGVLTRLVKICSEIQTNYAVEIKPMEKVPREQVDSIIEEATKPEGPAAPKQEPEGGEEEEGTEEEGEEKGGEEPKEEKEEEEEELSELDLNAEGPETRMEDVSIPEVKIAGVLIKSFIDISLNRDCNEIKLLAGRHQNLEDIEQKLKKIRKVLDPSRKDDQESLFEILRRNVRNNYSNQFTTIKFPLREENDLGEDIDALLKYIPRISSELKNEIDQKNSKYTLLKATVDANQQQQEDIQDNIISAVNNGSDERIVNDLKREQLKLWLSHLLVLKEDFKFTGTEEYVTILQKAFDQIPMAKVAIVEETKENVNHTFNETEKKTVTIGQDSVTTNSNKKPKINFELLRAYVDAATTAYQFEYARMSEEEKKGLPDGEETLWVQNYIKNNYGTTISIEDLEDDLEHYAETESQIPKPPPNDPLASGDLTVMEDRYRIQWSNQSVTMEELEAEKRTLKNRLKIIRHLIRGKEVGSVSKTHKSRNKKKKKENEEEEVESVSITHKSRNKKEKKEEENVPKVKNYIFE